MNTILPRVRRDDLARGLAAAVRAAEGGGDVRGETGGAYEDYFRKLDPLTGASADVPANAGSTTGRTASVGTVGEVSARDLERLTGGKADGSGKAGSATERATPVGIAAEDSARELEPLTGGKADRTGNAASATE